MRSTGVWSPPTVTRHARICRVPEPRSLSPRPVSRTSTLNSPVIAAAQSRVSVPTLGSIPIGSVDHGGSRMRQALRSDLDGRRRGVRYRRTATSRITLLCSSARWKPHGRPSCHPAPAAARTASSRAARSSPRRPSDRAFGRRCLHGRVRQAEAVGGCLLDSAIAARRPNLPRSSPASVRCSCERCGR